MGLASQLACWSVIAAECVPGLCITRVSGRSKVMGAAKWYGSGFWSRPAEVRILPPQPVARLASRALGSTVESGRGAQLPALRSCPTLGAPTEETA